MQVMYQLVMKWWFSETINWCQKRSWIYPALLCKVTTAHHIWFLVDCTLILFLLLFYINLYLGAYSPLTPDGNILVDGVVASCYASFDHGLAHIVMKPMQWDSNVLQNIFWEEDRFPIFIWTSKELGKWLLPTGQFLQHWCHFNDLLFNKTFNKT